MRLQGPQVNLNNLGIKRVGRYSRDMLEKEISCGFEFIILITLFRSYESIMRRSVHTSKSHLVILDVVLVLGSLCINLRPLRSSEVLGHLGVEGKHAGGGANLSVHVEIVRFPYLIIKRYEVQPLFWYF